MLNNSKWSGLIQSFPTTFFLIPLLVFMFIPYHTFAISLDSANDNQIVIKVGAYNNPPKITILPDGKVTGFWPELLSHIADKEGWRIEYVQGSWSEGLKRLYNGEIDIMPDVAQTNARSATYLFARVPVLSNWSRVYVRQNEKKIKSLKDMNGIRIGGLISSISVEGPEGVNMLIKSFNLRSRVFEFDTYENVFKALEDGFVDAVIVNRNYGDTYIKNHPVRKTMMMMSPYILTFAFNKQSAAVRNISKYIDNHMEKMMYDNESVYYKLLNKYFEDAVAEKVVIVMPRWFKIFMTVVFALGMFFLILISFSRMQVRRKTEELRHFNENLQQSIEEETSKRLKNEQIFFEQKKFTDMGHMIGAISHQWRQPLNSVSLISQWLCEEWEEGKEINSEHINSFKKQAEIIQNMSDTIDDFRYYYQQDIEKTNFNITEAVLSSTRLISSELFYDGINVTFKYKDTEIDLGVTTDNSSCCYNFPPTYAEGYEGEFKQILLSVLRNAKDSIKTKGAASKHIFIEIQDIDDKIIISIEDNGTGIDENILGNIFDPYFTTKKEGDGMGLGLYMSQMTLKKHMKGEISLENTDEGAKATITLVASHKKP